MLAQQTTYAIILTSSYLSLLGVSEFLYYQWKWKAEYTRKFVHIISGLISLSLPFLFADHWFILAIALFLIALLLFAKKAELLKSIYQIERNSLGDLLYPVSFYICFLVADNLNNNLYFVLPLLVLILSDSLAALVGKTWKWLPYTIGKCKKTVGGFITFLATALIFSIGCFILFEPSKTLLLLLIHSSLIVLGGSIIEAISPMGFDNLTIPVFILLLLQIL